MRHVKEEIGSEFWIDDVVYESDDIYHDFKENGFSGDNRLVLSGRTAIDYICQDIACDRKIVSVYMPAYCCDSMIYPFKNRDINVVFYDVRYEKGAIKCDIDTTLGIDILYICNYFGFGTGVDFGIVANMRRKGVIILYDKTHDFFNNGEPFVLISDYCFCSLRKWMGIPTGAIVSKKNGYFFRSLLKECDFVEDKRDGMRMKYFYLQGDSAIVKEDFFRLFTSFNKNLSRDYQDYLIDKTSLQLLNRQDLEQIKICRQRNAELLYEELSRLDYISMMFQYGNGCVPLFVPILVKKEIRNSLRKYLIDNNVYCPVHWSKSQLLSNSIQADVFYDSELSLVCDQRYGEGQMKRVVELIKNYCNRINI